MEYNYAKVRGDKTKIDALNKLRDLEKYWSDVSKLKRNVKNRLELARWKELSEIRFMELRKEAVLMLYSTANTLYDKVGEEMFKRIHYYGMGYINSIGASSFPESRLVASYRRQIENIVLHAIMPPQYIEHVMNNLMFRGVTFDFAKAGKFNGLQGFDNYVANIR